VGPGPPWAESPWDDGDEVLIMLVQTLLYFMRVGVGRNVA